MKEIRYSFDTDENIQKNKTQSIPEAYDEDEQSFEDSDENIVDDFDVISKDKDEDKESCVDNQKENKENCDIDNSEIETDEHLIERKLKKHIQHNKKFKRTRLKKILVVLLAMLGSAVCAAASPIFAVDEIVINDLNYFTKDDICKQIGLSSGVNGIFFNRLKAESILEASPYISSVKISFKLPDTMEVTVSENRICGYIEYLGSYLYIDRSGKVIDIKKETSESLPIIEGLKFSSFTINSEIPVENQDAFQAALSVSNAMCKYGVLDNAVLINVSDTQNLYAYIDNIKVLLADNSRMEEKIKTMAEAVKEIPEGDRGTLDLTDLSKPIIFKYTT